ncbi:unnamed protein product [Brassica napus]|uniref:(rape) hypothetical protein n=1 Tax=Brassica napus TaxID=3708 RepID=A0A816KV33_BRANA|nr:unnamed protein product [Brassica napus]
MAIDMLLLDAKVNCFITSTVFTRYCWEYFNLPIEPIPLQLDCKASELHCFPHLGTNQRPPQSNLEVLVTTLLIEGRGEESPVKEDGCSGKKAPIE